MTREGIMLERVADLRRAFDHTFSEPPVGVAEDTEGLLALRAGGKGYAVRLAEITGLFADRTIVRLPSPIMEFLGVAGLRHDVVPVYSLPSLLGDAAGPARPRWLITARAPDAVAFAFEQFEGYLQVPPSAIEPSHHETARAHVPATVCFADAMYGVVSIPSLVKTIEDLIRRTGTSKEQ